MLKNMSHLLVDDPEIDEILNLQSGEITPARELVTDDYQDVLEFRMQLMQSVSSGQAVYACPLCQIPVHLVSLKERRKFYFRHEIEDDRCPAKTKGQYNEDQIRAMKYHGLRESFAHLHMKDIIASSLRCDPNFSNIKIEKTWKGIEPNERRKPDVQALWKGVLPVAFEVQLSTTFLRVIAGRRDFYLRQGGLLLWVFQSFDMRDAKLTQDDIFYNNNRNAFVASDETLSASRARGQFSLDCIWSEPEIHQGQMMWAQRRRLGSFSEFVIEQDRQRVYLYDADGERERCEKEMRDRPLREDFRRYWLREPFISDQKQWEVLWQRFTARGIGFPRYLGDFVGLRALLDSLYSAREGKPVGWGHANLVKVAHHVFDKYKGHLWAFKLLLSAHNRGAQFLSEDDTTKWRRVKVPTYTKAWARNDPAFAPDTRYNDLIAFLFPEIANELSMPPRPVLASRKPSTPEVP